MKTVKLFPILLFGFAISLMLVSWTPKPLKVIVDEVIFVNAPEASAAQAQAKIPSLFPTTALDNLPRNHTKADTASFVNWYDDNGKPEGYLVRIESLTKNSHVNLEFTMMLKFENGIGKVYLFLPPANSLEQSELKNNAKRKTKLDVLLESKSGFKCELRCSSQGFSIINVGLNPKYRVVIFSKKDIK